VEQVVSNRTRVASAYSFNAKLWNIVNCFQRLLTISTCAATTGSPGEAAAAARELDLAAYGAVICVGRAWLFAHSVPAYPYTLAAPQFARVHYEQTAWEPVSGPERGRRRHHCRGVQRPHEPSTRRGGGGVPSRHHPCGVGKRPGRAVQVQPKKPMLKEPGRMSFELNFDKKLSTFEFNQLAPLRPGKVAQRAGGAALRPHERGVGHCARSPHWPRSRRGQGCDWQAGDAQSAVAVMAGGY